MRKVNILMAMHRMIIYIAKCVDINGVLEFIVMNGGRRINRRRGSRVIDFGVRVYFARVVTAKRLNVIFRCRIWRTVIARSMVTNTTASAVSIITVTARSTTRGGAIRIVRRLFRSVFVGIDDGISILIEQSINGFGKSSSYSVIKYSKA